MYQVIQYFNYIMVILLLLLFESSSIDNMYQNHIVWSLVTKFYTNCSSTAEEICQQSQSILKYTQLVKMTVVVYPLPWPLLVGGVRCSRLWSTSQLLRPSGQQCSHSGGVCPQIQGRQCGAYVGAVDSSLVFPFTEKDDKKGIAKQKNKKAAGINDVSVEKTKEPMRWSLR